MSRPFLLLSITTLFCTINAEAQTKSGNKSDEVTYNLKIEEMTSDKRLQKITTLLDKYKSRIVKYEPVLANKEIKLTLNEDENILNLLEVLSNQGYTAWYVDNSNNRVINTGKGYTEKFPEKQ